MAALGERLDESSVRARLLRQIMARSEGEQRAILEVLEKRPVKGKGTSSMAAPRENLGGSGVSSCLFRQILNRPQDEQQAILKVLEKRTGKEKRKHDRKPYFMVVRHNTGDRSCTDFIQNISAGGVFIASPMTFSVGQKISLAFPRPDYQDNIRIGGKIVRTCPQGIGVEFGMATPDQRAEIGGLMQMI
jgi:hypothetical protein